MAACHDPDGPSHLTAVPAVMRSGDAFNVVPGHGELFCDLRADEIDAIEAVVDSVPAEHGGVRLEAELIRRWPEMHSEDAVGGRLERAAAALGRPIVPASHDGASDAATSPPRCPSPSTGSAARGSGPQPGRSSCSSPRSRAAPRWRWR